MRGVRLAGRQYKIEAPSLILAIPPRAMELINFEDLSAAGAAHGELPTRLAARLLDVVRVPAFRAYLTYAEPWWQQWCGWSQGYAITDLPLRQVFYGFGLPAPPPAVPPSPEVATLNATNNSRVLMASYANAATTDFWLGLMKPGVHIQQTTGNAAPDALPLQQTMNRQLKELHGYQFDFPNVEWTCVVDWTADPYGAAWHAWRPNIDVQQAIPSMRQPLFLTRLFVCGEAFSHIQGWMEGALCSAELLLEEHFNLTRATWIPEGYPLGPALPEDSTNSTTA
jgi:monoamine oxidase